MTPNSARSCLLDLVEQRGAMTSSPAVPWSKVRRYATVTSCCRAMGCSRCGRR